MYILPCLSRISRTEYITGSIDNPRAGVYHYDNTEYIKYLEYGGFDERHLDSIRHLP